MKEQRVFLYKKIGRSNEQLPWERNWLIHTCNNCMELSQNSLSLRNGAEQMERESKAEILIRIFQLTGI